MRLAGQSAAKILNELSKLVEPGITTGEIDRQAALIMEREGCKSAFFRYRNFPGHICISLNEEVVHGIGKNRQIAYGDLVKIDVGINREGWIGDNAKSVICGMVSAEVERLAQGTHAMLKSVLPMATAGNRIGDISAHIEGKARAQGWGVVRDLVGHGVGSSLHEDPEVPNFGPAGKGPLLKPGMTIAVEPMINLGRDAVRSLADRWTIVTADGKPSAHFEYTLLITEEMPEILTPWDDEGYS